MMYNRYVPDAAGVYRQTTVETVPDIPDTPPQPPVQPGRASPSASAAGFWRRNRAADRSPVFSSGFCRAGWTREICWSC